MGESASTARASNPARSEPFVLSAPMGCGERAPAPANGRELPALRRAVGKTSLPDRSRTGQLLRSNVPDPGIPAACPMFPVPLQPSENGFSNWEFTFVEHASQPSHIPALKDILGQAICLSS